MHGRFWQKAYAGIHHFKGLLPLNSQKHAESVVIDSHTQTHQPYENTYTDILKGPEEPTLSPKPSLSITVPTTAWQNILEAIL